MNKLALTYDDIQLVPSYSEVSSRKKINLKTKLTSRYSMDIPLVASPMDTVCESEMAMKFMQMGGAGFIHRFMGIQEQKQQVIDVVSFRKTLPYSHQDLPVCATVGANGDFIERSIELIVGGVNVILIDVAHGHHKNVKDAIKLIKSLDPEIDVIAGNIATSQAALDLQEWGADGLRVGIGGGCFTPDMEVKTKNGFVKIKDINIGDLVFTHTGELKPVINKFIYEDYNEIYIIDGIETTANHKFYVIHQNKVDLVKNDDDIHRYAEWINADELNNEYFTVNLD
jgi:IMP dehydrogenase/GMP reductase